MRPSFGEMSGPDNFRWNENLITGQLRLNLAAAAAAAETSKTHFT